MNRRTISIVVIISIIIAFVLLQVLWRGSQLEINDKSGIDFSMTDVHPPTYYYALYGWSYLNPGMTEVNWGRELSVLFMAAFLVVVFFGLRKAFGKHGEIATFFLAMTSTFIHYGQEIRMYSLVLLLSAIVFYALVDGESVWLMLAACVSLFLLPNVHYFAGMAVFFFLIMWFVLGKVRVYSANERMVWGANGILLFVSGVGGILVAWFNFASPQLQRITGTWLAAADVSQFPSALISSLFYVEESQFAYMTGATRLLMVPMILVYFGTYVLIALLIYKFWKLEKPLKERDVLLTLMGCTLLAPLLALILQQEFVAMPLYHPRFFLVLVWMAAAMLLVLLSMWLEDKKRWVWVGVFLFFAVMFIGYFASSGRDLSRIEYATTCYKGVGVTIVHDSVFTYMPYQVVARQYGCLWNNVISTNSTRKMANGGGFDIIPEERIFWNYTLPAGPFLHVHGNPQRLLDRNSSVLYQGEGISLDAVSGVKGESLWDDMQLNLSVS